MFAGLRTAARSVSRRLRSLSDKAFCARAFDSSSARAVTVADEGLFAPWAVASKSLASCCFCSAVTWELLGWMAMRSARTLATLCCTGVGEAAAAGGVAGGAGVLGGVTPCWALLRSRMSLACCLMITSDWATAVAESSIVRLIRAQVAFIGRARCLFESATGEFGCQLVRLQEASRPCQAHLDTAILIRPARQEPLCGNGVGSAI